MNLKIDPLTVTLDELEQMDTVVPGVLDALIDGKIPTTPPMLKAVGWLLRHREDPTFTMEQASQLTLGDFVGESPKEPNGQEPSPDSASSTESAQPT